MQKPKLVYDPSDQSTPYKKVNIEELILTKSPSKKTFEAAAPESKKIVVYKSTINLGNKSCKICLEPLEGNPSVLCVVCGDGYHCYCHEPRVGKTTRKSTWKCIMCRPKEEPTTSTQQSASTSRRSSLNKSDNQSEVDTNEFSGFEELAKKKQQQTNGNAPPPVPAPSSPEDSLLPDGTLKVNTAKARALFSTSHNIMPNIDTIPDCSNWECDQVYDYFHKFFPNEAYIFKDQEIDGTSLLLMTRSDMLKFNLKLGPALNIYRHVVMLQTRSYDPRKCWK